LFGEDDGDSLFGSTGAASFSSTAASITTTPKKKENPLDAKVVFDAEDDDLFKF